MEEKLKRNDYKGGWHHCSLAYLYDRILIETKELRKAMSYKASIQTDEDRISECIDIANFAMMLAYNLNEKIKVKLKGG